MSSTAKPASDAADWRYERKLHVTGEPLWRAEAVLRTHPAIFRVLYEPRWVNNVYFDDAGDRAYYDNVEGVASRLKVRIRWYGELLGEVQPTLELKIKSGMVGRKESFRLPVLNMRRGIRVAEINEHMRRADLPEWVRPMLASVRPALVNRYRRRYYRSGDQRFRATLDDALQFWGVRGGCVSFMARWEQRNAIILELKYASEHDRDARQVTAAFPYRVTRSSKYVTGLELVRS